MEIKKQIKDSKLTLIVSGRIDTGTAPKFGEAIVLDDVNELIIDLTDVDYISSAGLRVFLATQQKINSADKKMAIKGARPIVKEIFDIVGFSDDFTFI